MQLFSKDIEHIQLPNANLIYDAHFLNHNEASKIFNHLNTQTPWQEDDITVFGKTYKQPRLTAFYSENNKSYGYSGIELKTEPFTPILNEIKYKIEEKYSESFNSVLLNLYRNGNDSNGWHADNEKELGTNPVIASLSLGEERPFHFKHKTIKEERHKLLLKHGSLLIMKGEMQHFWLHQIAKTKKKINERINLTFRFLI